MFTFVYSEWYCIEDNSEPSRESAVVGWQVRRGEQRIGPVWQIHHSCGKPNDVEQNCKGAVVARTKEREQVVARDSDRLAAQHARQLAQIATPHCLQPVFHRPVHPWPWEVPDWGMDPCRTSWTVARSHTGKNFGRGGTAPRAQTTQQKEIHLLAESHLHWKRREARKSPDQLADPAAQTVWVSGDELLVPHVDVK